MRIVFSSLASHGHIYPLVPLALAARDAGHEVVFATGGSFPANISSFGLDAVPAGIGMYEAFLEANGGVVDRANLTPERRLELARAVFGTILPRAFRTGLQPVLEEFEPDLVVYEAANLGAFFAARAAGIPRVCHGFGRVAGDAVHHPLRGSLTDIAKAVGAESPAGAESGVEEVPGLGDPYLDIYPPSLQDKDFLEKGNRIPLRPVPVSEPGELPESVATRDRARPLVYLTLGTAFGVIPVLREAIDGLSGLDVDVLVAAGPSIDARALGDVPDGVEVEAWVPQAKLLPHVDLVVHHGGSGTTLGALAHGLPQLLLPQGADQFTNAEAVATAGAGVQLVSDEQTAEAVATKAKQLLIDDQVRTAARAVAVEIAAMPAPEETVAVLTEIAADR